MASTTFSKPLGTELNTYNFGNVASLSAFESALDTFCGNMKNYDRANVAVRFTSASALFGSTFYMGDITRINTVRYQVELRQTNSNVIIYGYRGNDVWTWDKIQLNGTIGNFNFIEMASSSSAFSCVITMTGDARMLIFAGGNSLDRLAGWIVCGNGSNTYSKELCTTGSQLSLTTASNKVTIAKTGSSVVTLYCMVLYGASNFTYAVT